MSNVTNPFNDAQQPVDNNEEYQQFLKLMQKYGGTVSSEGVQANPEPVVVQDPTLELVEPDWKKIAEDQQRILQQYAQSVQQSPPPPVNPFGQPMYAPPQQQLFGQAQPQYAPPQGQNVQPLIVQNVLRGPLHIADLKLTLNPGEPWDLGFNPQARMSRDLAKCSQYGFVKTLTEEEYFNTLQSEAYQTMMVDQDRDMRLVQGNNVDLVLEAEHIDMTSRSTGQQEMRQASVNANNPFIRGAQYMNANNQQNLDPAAYHQALAQQSASRQGKKMSVAQIYDPVAAAQSKATVMSAPNTIGGGAVASQQQMMNFNQVNQRYVAPVGTPPQFAAPNPFLQGQQMPSEGALSVDLSNDSASDDPFASFDEQTGGGFRRLS